MEDKGFIITGTVMKKIFATLMLILVCVNYSMGYDNKTAHREFNTAMVTQFKSSAPAWTEFKYYNFGFELIKVPGPAVTASGYFNVTTEDRSYTIKDWIREGGYSADEPEAPAAYRHFYDPLANDGKTHLTDINAAGAQFNPDVDAIYWHFMGNDVGGSNDWSWYKAKEYMIKAITTGDEKIRNQNLAMAFRALGEVLHNTADMGCPPHVRNDAHGGFGLGGSDPFEGGFQPAWIAKYASNTCDPTLKSQFIGATSAMLVNKLLARFTNKYFFSDETISGTGVEQYSSRNGKKDYANPKLDRLAYETESFNYYYDFPSGRKVQICNDQSVLLGFLTSNFRSYPRVTLKNAETQASELVPAIIEAGVNVMHRFIPVFAISLEIKPQDKLINGTVKHTATGEYPNSLHYNGKVSFLVDGKISTETATASNGNFSVTETDKKFPNAKKITAYIELADIMIKSNEYDFSATQKYNQFDLNLGMPVKVKVTNLVTNEISYTPAFVDNSSFTGPISFSNNIYTGSWNKSDTNPKNEGSVKVTLDGEKTATVEFTSKFTYTNGDSYNYTFVSKAIPFAYKAAGQIMFSTAEAYNFTSSYSYLWTRPGYEKREYTAIEKDETNQTGGITLTLYIQ